MADFDPDKYLQEDTGFDPDAYLEKDEAAFDPSAYLGEEPVAAKEEAADAADELFVDETESALEAGAKGALTGFTMGFYDEIMGGLNAAVEAMKQQLGPEVTETVTFQDLYARERDKVREELKRLEEQHGPAFMTGEVAGALGGFVVPTGLAARAATGLAKAAKATLGAAASGAASGAGFSEAEDLEDIAADAAKGALAGAAIGGVGSAVGRAFRKIPEVARNSQLKKLGYTTGRLEKMPAEEQGQLAKMARDMNLITSDPKVTAQRAADLRMAAAERLGQFHSKVADKDIQFVDRDRLVAELQKEILPKYAAKDTREAGQLIKDIAEELQEAGPGFEDMQKIYTRIGQHSADFRAPVHKRMAAKELYRAMSQNMDDSLEAAGRKLKDPGLREQYRRVNREFRLANNLAGVTDKMAQRAADEPGIFDKPMRLAKYLGVSTVSGSPAAGVSAAIMDRLRDKYGASMLAKAQKVAESGGQGATTLKELVKRGQVDKIASYLAGQSLATDQKTEEEKAATRQLLRSLRVPQG